MFKKKWELKPVREKKGNFYFFLFFGITPKLMSKFSWVESRIKNKVWVYVQGFLQKFLTGTPFLHFGHLKSIKFGKKRHIFSFFSRRKFHF